MIEEKTIEKTDEKIQKILDSEITSANLDNLYKLTKIRHMAKEDKEMYKDSEGYNGRSGYGRDNYGREMYGRENYGREMYGEGYGARGRRRRYRGDDHLERMMDEYGRYREGRSNYGDNEETDKSFYFMVKALEDFIKVLYEEAESPQQKQQLKQALQNSMM